MCLYGNFLIYYLIKMTLSMKEQIKQFKIKTSLLIFLDQIIPLFLNPKRRKFGPRSHALAHGTTHKA